MDFAQLTADLRRLAPFESNEDAQLSLTSSLEVLGFLLPGHLVQALEAALPPQCAAPIESGRAVSKRPGGFEPAPGIPLSGQQLERIQEICAALGKLLSAELVRDLMRELPAPLASAFDGSAARAAEDAMYVAHLAPTGTRHLSEAKIGSTHPLWNGRPSGAQQDSVAAANPHQETKLSSARGLTQEREGESLADTSGWRKRRKDGES